MEIFLPSTASNKHNLRLVQLFKKMIKRCFTYCVLAIFKKTIGHKAKVMSDYHKQPVLGNITSDRAALYTTMCHHRSQLQICCLQRLCTVQFKELL